MRGFGIGHRHPAVGAEHDKAMRHGVQRPIEALGKAVRLLLLRHRRKKHIAHRIGEFADREQERR